MIATLVIIGLVVLHLRSKGSRRKVYRFTVIVMMVFAFFVKPYEGMDLYEHYIILNIMRSIGLQHTVAMYPWLFSTLPVYAGVFYAVSLLGFNQVLLMIAYGLIYGLQFKVLQMVAKDYELADHQERIGAVLILLITNAFFCTTVRNVLAFAIMSYFLYWDLGRGEKRIVSFIVYVLLCLFHNSVVVLLAMRILLLVFNKTLFKPLLLSILMWAHILSFVESRLRLNSILYLQNIAEKIRVYSTKRANELWVGGIANRIMITLITIVIVLVLIQMIKNHKKSHAKYNLYELFYVMISLFCIGGFSTIAITNRFIYMAAYMLVPVFLIENKSGKGIMLKMGSSKINPVLALSFALFISYVIFQYPYFSFGI